jgi:hypothetical protein
MLPYTSNAVTWPAPITIVWPPPAWAVDPIRRPAKARAARRPSVARMIAVAKKAGATSITTPAGYRINFGEPEATDRAADNPWDEILTHAAN